MRRIHLSVIDLASVTRTERSGNNELFIFGGLREERQISKLTGCSLERVGSLSFDHFYGTCAAVNDNEIYLCFNLNIWGDFKKFRKANDPMGVFEEINPTNYEHVFGRIGASSGKS